MEEALGAAGDPRVVREIERVGQDIEESNMAMPGVPPEGPPAEQVEQELYDELAGPSWEGEFPDEQGDEDMIGSLGSLAG